MKNRIRFVFALALLCAAWSTASFASSMYIVQGIAGRDFAAATDPAFPLDVLLNDEVCYVRGLSFGTITGPLTFEPGTYNIKISMANSLAPCTNTPLINHTVTIEPRTDVSAVITLNEAGVPVLETFTNNFTPVATNTTRLLLLQTAGSPALQVTLQNVATKKSYTYSVNPGAPLDVNLPSGAYTVEISQGTTTLVSATNLALSPQSVALVYAIGQSVNNTVVVETRTLRDVI